MLSEIEKLLVGTSQMEKRKLEKWEKCVVGGCDQRGGYHSGHPPPFCRGLSLQPNLQKEGLGRTSIFRGDLLGKRWVAGGGGGVAIFR